MILLPGEALTIVDAGGDILKGARQYRP